MSGLLSRSGDPPARDGAAPAALILVTAILFVLRLAAASQIHLTEDEAYYRLWSMTPAFGYFDHPPMIAWWIAAGRAALGDTPLGVRAFSICAAAATSFLVYDLARLAGAETATAERAGLWFNAMLLPLAGGLLAVPDSPAGLFWTAALVCVLRATRAGSAGPWWVCAGVMAGCLLYTSDAADE